jgi:hypothetical protein
MGEKERIFFCGAGEGRVLEKKMEALYDEWLRDASSRGVFAPAPADHDCAVTRCALRRIPLYYCDNDGGVCMGPSPPTMGWLGGEMVYFERGGQPECRLEIEHGRSVAPREQAVFFCLATGTPHMCGAARCTRAAETADGTSCMLTGTELEAGRVTTGQFGDWTPTPGRVARDTAEFGGANLAARAFDFVGAVARAPRLEPTFDSFWGHALMYIGGLLSPQRFALDEHAAGQRETALRGRLARHLATRHPPYDLLELVLVAVRFRQRHSPVAQVAMSPEAMRGLARHYAAIVLGLWGILRVHVPGGAALAKRSAFKDFVLAALELYKLGIAVRDRTDQFDVELLAADPVLAVVTITDEARELAIGRVTASASRLRKAIAEKLQDAVSAHHVSPELLRVAEAAQKNREWPKHVFQ